MHKGLLFIAICLLCYDLPASADDCKVVRNDHSFVEGSATDKNGLLVFVSGFRGNKTWTDLLALVRADAAFAHYDYLIYHTPKSLSIPCHVERINELTAAHNNLILVGHSIGGFVIRKLVADQGAANHPLFVFTFGTPLENQEHFHLNFFYKLLSRARFLMRTLALPFTHKSRWAG